ncbi:MAG: HAD family phosphatase [Erysipelotrichaceae bacterium]|nr:HAD family phosphatase [Erysipelotrichaceae bacterium]
MPDKSIKLICFDMDCTMLNEEGKVSDYSMEVLRRAHEKGLKLAPVSGRSLDALLIGISDLSCFDYVICTNGTVIHDAGTLDIIKRHSLKKETAVRYYDNFVSCNRDNYVVVNGFYLGKYGYTQFLRSIKYRNETEFESLLKLFREQGLPEVLKDEKYQVDKVIANFDDIPLRDRMYEELIAENLKERKAIITSSFENNIEIFDKDSGKDVAVKDVADMYGFTMDEVMAIGDNDNDVEMLKAAGLSVAMGNGTDSAKEFADYVTLSNAQDGAVKAIEKLVLADMK